MRMLLLATLLVALPAGAKPVTDIGQHEGVAYRIDIPQNWNHELVVFYHGYALDPEKFRDGEPISPMFTPLLQRGYAVAQSAYSQTGWAVEQAQADTEKLRAHFTAKHGKPRQNYVMGMSMGGTLTALTIETKPDIYAGALSLCGALEPSDRLVQRDLALRAAFDYYFPDVLAALPAANAEPFGVVEAKIVAALQSKPSAMQSLLRWYAAADARNFASVILFAGYEIAELDRRAHGLPVGNADMIYVGSGDDAALNDGVHRYRADAQAATYLARWYTPSGKLTRPFIDLHDTGDPLVPASSIEEYALAAARAGHADNFVQQYVNREGHCVFTPAEIAKAFDELVEWTHSGKRPESGKLR